MRVKISINGMKGIEGDRIFEDLVVTVKFVQCAFKYFGMDATRPHVLGFILLDLV